MEAAEKGVVMRNGKIRPNYWDRREKLVLKLRSRWGFEFVYYWHYLKHVLDGAPCIKPSARTQRRVHRRR